MGAGLLAEAKSGGWLYVRGRGSQKLAHEVGWTDAGIKAGANCFLAKTFDLRKVEDLLRRLLENNADQLVTNGSQIDSGRSAWHSRDQQ